MSVYERMGAGQRVTVEAGARQIVRTLESNGIRATGGLSYAALLEAIALYLMQSQSRVTPAFPALVRPINPRPSAASDLGEGLLP